MGPASTSPPERLLGVFTPLGGVVAVHFERSGTARVVFDDGRVATTSLGDGLFAPTSAVASSTYLPRSSALHLQTTRRDRIAMELPRPGMSAPVQGRPTIYLDQNHWSTIAKAIHQPGRVADQAELAAAEYLIGLGIERKVVLPLSSAHMAETCKQHDPDERYQRALTLAQLSAGWQLRHPMEVRRLELRRVLARRYHGYEFGPVSTVTLESGAVHGGSVSWDPPADSDLSEDMQLVLRSLVCTSVDIDVMLDAEQVPMTEVPGWALGFMEFGAFLRDNPTGRELKRRRTHAKFIADLGQELAYGAHAAGISPEQMSDWTLNLSEADLMAMPALGLYREVMHEKLCDPCLQWEQNDLVDMMFLTVGTGYCDHVVAERSHAGHLRSSLRRLGRPYTMHRNLRELVEHL